MFSDGFRPDTKCKILRVLRIGFTEAQTGKLAMNAIHDETGRTFTDDYTSTKSRQTEAQATDTTEAEREAEPGTEKARLPVANPGTLQETVSSHHCQRSQTSLTENFSDTDCPSLITYFKDASYSVTVTFTWAIAFS